MDIYDPNITWVKQTVEVDLQAWDHKVTMTAEVGGNCFGFDVMECAISQIYEKMLPGDGESPARFHAMNAEGDDLLSVDEDERGEDWLKNFVVAVRIVNQPKPANGTNRGDPLEAA